MKKIIVSLFIGVQVIGIHNFGEIQLGRTRGRPETGWKDTCRRDMDIVALSADEVMGRAENEEKHVQVYRPP